MEIKKTDGDRKSRLFLAFSRRVCVLTVIMMLFTLCGCGSELEDKKFPVSVGAEGMQGEYQIYVEFPQLSDIANQNTDSTNAVFAAESGKNLEGAWKTLEKNSYKELDYNHVKILVLGESLWEEQDALQEFVDVLENEKKLSGNILVFASEEPASEILEMGEVMEETVGNTLEDLIDRKGEQEKKKTIVNLQTLYNAQYSDMGSFLVPLIEKKSHGIEITGYLYMDNLKSYTRLTREEGEYVFLARGWLKNMEFGIETEEEEAEDVLPGISEIRVSSEIQEKEGKPIQMVRISGNMEADHNNLKMGEKEVEELITCRMMELDEILGKDENIDLTGSFPRLGNRNRELYAKYNGDRKQYEKDLENIYLVDISVVNKM